MRWSEVRREKAESKQKERERETETETERERERERERGVTCPCLREEKDLAGSGGGQACWCSPAAMMSWYQRSRFIAGSAPRWSWWLCSPPEEAPRRRRRRRG